MPDFRQVYFDAGQNKICSDFDGAQLSLVKGRWVDIRIEIDLDADTQSFWYDGQNLYTKSWKNGVSGNGLKNIAAVDVYGNNAGPVYYDDAKLVPVTTGLSGLLPLVANPAPDDRWYADVPLAVTGATRIAVGFQNNAAGCNSVPQKRTLLNQAEKDTRGVDAEVLTYDPSNQVATVRFHHAVVYGKMDAVRYHFDGHQWQRIEQSSNQASEVIGASAPLPQR